MINLLWDFFLTIGWTLVMCMALALFIIGVSFCWHFGQVLVPIAIVRWQVEKAGKIEEARAVEKARAGFSFGNSESPCPSYDPKVVKRRRN